MANPEEPIRIVIEEEDLPLVPDKAVRQAPDLKAQAEKVGQKAGEAAQKAWDSESRRKVTDSVKQGVTAVATKSTKAIGTKVADTVEQQTREQVNALQNRVQEVDWKEEARKGTVSGLQWLSAQFARLAERFSKDDGVNR
jgi:hypothetical protein